MPAQWLLFYCTWVRKSLVEIISHSLFNIIEYAITWYYKYKISGSRSPENTPKIVKKKFFGSSRVWTGDHQVMGPACYKRAMETCCYWQEFFMVLQQNSLCSEDFCSTYFPILRAREKIAKIFMWQLDFLRKLTKVDRTDNYFFIIWPKTTLWDINLS